MGEDDHDDDYEDDNAWGDNDVVADAMVPSMHIALVGQMVTARKMSVPLHVSQRHAPLILENAHRTRLTNASIGAGQHGKCSCVAVSRVRGYSNYSLRLRCANLVLMLANTAGFGNRGSRGVRFGSPRVLLAFEVEALAIPLARRGCEHV